MEKTQTKTYPPQTVIASLHLFLKYFSNESCFFNSILISSGYTLHLNETSSSTLQCDNIELDLHDSFFMEGILGGCIHMRSCAKF